MRRQSNLKVKKLFLHTEPDNDVHKHQRHTHINQNQVVRDADHGGAQVNNTCTMCKSGEHVEDMKPEK